MDAAALPSPPRTGVPAARVLVYDGDCPMCAGIADALVRRAVLPAVAVRPAASFSEPLASRLEAAGIRNEMAVLDPASGEIRSGADGLLWGLRDTRLRWACRLLDRPLIRPAVVALYRLVSSNRRLFAVPDPRSLPCACEPDDRPLLRWTLVALFVAFATAVIAAFGTVFLRELGRRSALGPAMALVAIAGAGWALLLPASAGVPRERRGAYLAHLAATAAAGATLLLPSIVLAFFAHGIVPRAVHALSLAASFLLMLGMQRKRVRHLRLSRRWVAIWAAALVAGTTSAWCLLLE